MKTPSELRAEATRLLKLANRIEKLPEEDPYADGAVLIFVHYVPETLSEAPHAAVRNGGFWRVAGRAVKSPANLTWRDLLNFVGDRDLETLRVVTATTPVVSE